MAHSIAGHLAPFIVVALAVACSGGSEFTSPADPPSPAPSAGTNSALTTPGTGGSNSGGASALVGGSSAAQSSVTLTGSASGTGGALGTGGAGETGGSSSATGGNSGASCTGTIITNGCYPLRTEPGWSCSENAEVCPSSLYCVKRACN